MRSRKISTPEIFLLAAVATVAATFVSWRHHRRKSRKKGGLDGVLQCKCGLVRIQINAPSAVHIICYCDDCQNYETFCKERRKLSERYDFCRIADKNGGVRVCQIFKTELRVLQGYDQLRPTAINPKLLNVKPPWQMFRIHSDCCKCPMISACWKDLSVVGVFAANFLCGNDEEDRFRMSTSISAHPSTFDWDTENESGLPPIGWRINKKCAKHPKDLDTGGQGFPPFFVTGFLRRNFVLGPSRKGPHPLPLPPKGKEVLRDM